MNQFEVERTISAVFAREPFDANFARWALSGLIASLENSNRIDNWNAHYARRKIDIKALHKTIVHELEAVKLETLDSLRESYPIKSAQGGSSDYPFSEDDLNLGLRKAIEIHMAAMLNNAAEQVNTELGFHGKVAISKAGAQDFLQARQNLMRNVAEEIFLEIKNLISDGIDKGISLSEISKQIEDRFDEISSGRAITVASTEVAAAYGFGRNEALQASGAKRKKWLGSGLPNMRPAHRAASGQLVAVDQPFTVMGEKLMYPGDQAGSPGNVINCFPEDTEVSAVGIQKSYRRWYEGDMVTAHLGSGRIITATPNHPVLSQRGWVAIGELDHSDYLVGALSFYPFSIWNPDVNHRPTTLDKIHSSLQNTIDEKWMLGGLDFHGDGENGEVDIKSVNGFLSRGAYTALLQHLPQGFLAFSDAIQKHFVSDGPGNHFSVSPRFSTASSMSRCRDLEPVCASGFSHPESISLGITPYFNSTFHKPSPDNDPFQFHSSGNRELGFSRLVAFYDVIDIDIKPVRCFVHNLQTKSGYYLANGIASHNCHCVAIPVK